MFSFRSRVITALGAAVLAGCAHHDNVRPSAGDVHTVVLGVDRKGEGYGNALGQAQHFCKETRKQGAVVVSENTEYIGTMDERSYNNAKAIGSVLSGVGASASAMSNNHRTRDQGSGALIVGQSVSNAVGQGYRYTLTFKCQ